MTFAIKRVHVERSRAKQFLNPKREATVLRKFRDNRHEHLISILATYIHHKAYHFIFPWAMADLHGYWRDINRTPSMAESDEDLAWLAAQCQGLAEGLSYIHRYETASFKYLIHPDSLPTATEAFVKAKGSQRKLRLFGRHGDIKPENILYFPRYDQDMRGLLKITDFGCADFSTKEEVDCKRRGSVPNSPTYRAPETDLSPDDSSITSSYDVWTLGCVYLEFLTWWLGGWMYVKDFAERRSELDPYWYGQSYGHFKTDFFFTIFEESNGKKRAEVRKGVKEVSMFRRLSNVPW
jgi:serine/threonine protein kinase